MSPGGQSRIVLLAVVWIVLIALAAVTYRLMVVPSRVEKQDLGQAIAEYENLSEQARARGITAEPLPEGADSEQVMKLAADLKQRLTGSDPIAMSPDNTIAIALDSFSGYCILRSSAFKDALAARGLGLRLVDDGADYGARFDALAGGATPAAVFTVDALLKLAMDRGELPGTIVMVIDETVGADAMIAYDSAVPYIDALNRSDARIVITPDSPSETLARVVLDNFRLDSLTADPFVMENGAAEVFERFVQARRDDPRAYVLWEPYVAKALEQPGAQVLMDSSRFRGFIVDVLVVQRDYLLHNEQVVKDLVESYFRVLYSLADRSAMAELVREDARRGGEPITSSQAQRLVEGIWWKNTRENYAHFGLLSDGEAGGVAGIEQIIRNIAGVLQRTGAASGDPTQGQPNRAYYDRVLRSLLEQQFHPGVGDAGSLETIRSAEAVRPLTDQEWDSLAPVGTLSIARLVFARGTATLTTASEHALRSLAGTLESFPQYYLVITGHASRQGDAEANRILSRQRAEATAAYLQSLGVPSHRMRVQSAEPTGTGGREQSVSFTLSQRPY